MPRDHFASRRMQVSHYQSHHYPKTKEAKFEARVEMFLSRVLRTALWIPRRLWRFVSGK
jgi:hypothetical protein